MQGVYTLTCDGQARTTAGTLVAVFSTAADIFEVLDVWVTQEDVETSEQWGVQLVELTANDGTGTSQGLVALSEGEVAATITGKINYSVEPSAATDPIYRWGFNKLTGLWVSFPDRALPRAGLGTAQGIALELLTAPGASTTVSAGMTVRQIRL